MEAPRAAPGPPTILPHPTQAREAGVEEDVAEAAAVATAEDVTLKRMETSMEKLGRPRLECRRSPIEAHLALA